MYYFLSLTEIAKVYKFMRYSEQYLSVSQQTWIYTEGQILKAQESSIRLLCVTDHTDHESREISYF